MNPIGISAAAEELAHQAQAGAPIETLLRTAEGLEVEADRPGAPETVEQLFRARLAIHRRLPSLDETQVLLARRFFAALRTLEDRLLEVSLGLPDDDADAAKFSTEPRRPLLDPAPFYDLRLAPGFELGAKPFRSGDVLLARGPSFLSASIAQLPDPPGHFSHLVLIHVAEGGETRTLESYHHAGLASYGLDFALRNSNLRLALLRPRDAALGAAASRALFERVERSARPIPYDFDQNFDEHSSVSCAEVASWAYELGSNGTVRLPAHPSAVNIEPRLRAQLGLSTARTFEPLDLELDPRFELLAEWRDLRFSRDARHRDAIAFALFDWATRLGYRFHGSLRTTVATRVILPLRRTPLWPLLSRVGVPPLAPSMPPHLLGLMQQIDECGHRLLGTLRPLDREHARVSGAPMSPSRLREALERERALDAARFEAGKRSWHAIFRP